MTYYHLSYDVNNSTPERNDMAQSALINVIEDKLMGVITNRPVASTFVFYSSLSFDAIRSELFSWSREMDVFYILSQIAESADASLLCRLVANKNLEEKLHEIVERARQVKNDGEQ